MATLNDTQTRTLKYQTEVQQGIRAYLESTLNQSPTAEEIGRGIVDVIAQVGRTYAWTSDERALPDGGTTLYIFNKENAADAIGRAAKAAMAYKNLDALTAILRMLPEIENGVAVYFGMKDEHEGPKPSAPGQGTPSNANAEPELADPQKVPA